jgi:hypothetical protein
VGVFEDQSVIGERTAQNIDSIVEEIPRELGRPELSLRLEDFRALLKLDVPGNTTMCPTRT